MMGVSWVGNMLSLCLASILFLTATVSVRAESGEPTEATEGGLPFVMIEASPQMRVMKANHFRSELGCYLASVVASYQQGIQSACFERGGHGAR